MPTHRRVVMLSHVQVPFSFSCCAFRRNNSAMTAPAPTQQKMQPSALFKQLYGTGGHYGGVMPVGPAAPGGYAAPSDGKGVGAPMHHLPRATPAYTPAVAGAPVAEPPATPCSRELALAKMSIYFSCASKQELTRLLTVVAENYPSSYVNNALLQKLEDKKRRGV